ncbi:hypothetical protein MSAN_01237600 [Mycena sanguinolenta]|uniref:Uncharacterized protein n=1 Tax=Mycena sanguinolenta TaxID=230812 RepID=A0A8H6YI43_9AGAR|nr:hypothetical protein MSAN_01237600 [Mycena sanguinolenta]
MSHSPDQPHVVIIGAGMSGMAMAIELKRTGFTNFTIIEKASEVGGTWRDNKYPGCASDSAIHLYSLSSDLNPDWLHSVAFQPTIQEYWLQLASKYDLYSSIIFNRRVVSAQWDMRTQKYDIITEELDGTLIPLTAAILISAAGLLERPKFPDIPGISNFRGDSFHSGRWDSSISLAGKRVAIIGSGPSATQIVPLISKDPGISVTQFCRSRSWILPPVHNFVSVLSITSLKAVQIRREYSTLQSQAHIMNILGLVQGEYLYFTIFASHTGNQSIERDVKAYMMHATPPEYVGQVIPSDPDHKVGCKRVVFDTDYLPSLARPNMSIVWDPIESITEDGLRTKEGSVTFDVIIYTTGYMTDDYPIHVKGVHQTVNEYYQAHGGPTAYLGTTLPGFPNFFLISGPNTATGYTSLFFAIEVQIQYIVRMIKPVIASEISSMEITSEATDDYNRDIQRRLSGFIWSKCFSWYRTGNTGKIHGLFPGSMILYWWWMRNPKWAHYKVVTTGHWKPKDPIHRRLGAAFLGVGVVGVAYLGWRST